MAHASLRGPGPARPLAGTKAIRRAHFRLGHRAPGRGRRRARTVSGCVNSAFLNISLAPASWSPVPRSSGLANRFRCHRPLRKGTVPTPSVEFTVPPRSFHGAAKAGALVATSSYPWCLQRADTAQSLYFSTRVLAIHNPARCRCW